MSDATTDVTGVLAGLSVLNDPSVKSDLSPPAQALAAALDTGIASALGLGSSLTEAGINKLGDLVGQAAAALAGSVGESAADIIGNIASAVPMVGAIVKMGASLFGMMAAANSEESQAAACQHTIKRLTPLPTGSILAGGGTVPADIFAPVFKMNTVNESGKYVVPPGLTWESSNGQQLVCLGIGGPTVSRSMTALVLMQITEGAVVDQFDDWNWSKLRAYMLRERPAAAAKWKTDKDMSRAWWHAVERDVRLSAKQWEKHWGDIMGEAGEAWAKWGVPRPVLPPLGAPPGTRGLPAPWRRRFRRLRRAIESAYGPTLPKGARSDGGLGFWVIYLDLLNQAFRKGYLSLDFCTFLLARQLPLGTAWNGPAHHDLMARVMWDYKAKEIIDGATDGLVAAPPTWAFGPYRFFDGACPPILIANMVAPLVRGWQNTVSPYYTQGQQRIEQIEAAQAPQRTDGPKSGQIDVPPADLDDSGILGGVVATAGAFGALALLVHTLGRPRATG